MNRANQVLEAVDRLTINGRPPTVREIGDYVGLRSTSTVQGYIERLIRRGELERDPETPRSLRRPKSREPRRLRVVELAESCKLAADQAQELPVARLYRGVAIGLMMALDVIDGDVPA